MNDFGSWAQTSRFYEQLKLVVDIKKTLSSELRALKVMHNLRLLMTRKIMGHELKALDAIHRLGLSMTWKTLGRELKALDTMNSSRLWMT